MSISLETVATSIVTITPAVLFCVAFFVQERQAGGLLRRFRA